MRNHDRRTYLTDEMLPPGNNLKYAKSTLQSSQSQCVNHNNPANHQSTNSTANHQQAKSAMAAAAAAQQQQPTDWNAQVQQFQRFLQWQQYQEKFH